MTTTLSTAFQNVLGFYDVQQKDITPLVGVSKATMCRWKSGESEPLIHRVPLMANALDSLCVGGGAMLLNPIFGLEFGPSIKPPLTASEAISQVFQQYKMTASQVAIKAGTSSSTLTRWKLGHNSPNLYQAQNLYKALDIVRPGSGLLLLELLTGRTINDNQTRKA